MTFDFAAYHDLGRRCQDHPHGDAKNFAEVLASKRVIDRIWGTLRSTARSLGIPSAQRNPPEVKLFARGEGGGLSFNFIDLIHVSVNSDLPSVTRVLFHELCHKQVGYEFDHTEPFLAVLNGALHDVYGDLGIDKFRRRGYDLDFRADVVLRRRFLEHGANAILGPLAGQ